MKTTLILISLMIATSAYAFKINPMNREIGEAAPHGSVADKYSEPVHEIITRIARERFVSRCLQENPNDAVCKLNSSPNKIIQDSLIRGIWWNDDPNQDLYELSLPRWLGHMWDAEHVANRNADAIGSNYIMHYRSHYGDMQFIHSMASKDFESSKDTKRKIFMWAEFTYRMATNELGPRTLFKQVRVGHLADFFDRQANWELRWVMEPRYRLKDTPNDFADHALGSLLHMVQDSYSSAHVERDYSASSTCPAGHIKQFLSYTHQDPSKHGAADTLAAFRGAHYPEGAGPVETSSQLIWFARHRSDWDKEVAPYLNNIVYCTEGDLAAAGPGPYLKTNK